MSQPDLLDGSEVDTYDSVQGHVVGSDVYIIYDDYRAYPEYLITY